MKRRSFLSIFAVAIGLGLAPKLPRVATSESEPVVSNYVGALLYPPRHVAFDEQATSIITSASETISDFSAIELRQVSGAWAWHDYCSLRCLRRNQYAWGGKIETEGFGSPQNYNDWA